MKAQGVESHTAGSATIRLGRRMGVEPEYVYSAGKRGVIAPEVIRSVLSAMQCDVADDAEAETFLQQMEAAGTPRRLPPVLVVREDQRPIHIPINVSPAEAGLLWRLVLEDGTIAFEGIIPESRPDGAAAAIGSHATLASCLTLAQKLPCGYHRVEMEDCVMPLIVTPVSCWLPPALENGGRIWELAAELYLLRSAHSWGIGDFSDLAALIDLAAKSGASVIGLNPLHAMFLDDPEHASPYSPASRLFLNALNIDVESKISRAKCLR